MHSRLRPTSLLLCVVLLATLLPFAVPAYAAVLTVNSTNDPGDGTCNAAECTLREALRSAVAGDTINITATGTIQVQDGVGPLPTITQGSLTINGPVDGQGRPALIIDGTTLGTGFGLNIESSNNVIRNLSIVNFSGDSSSGGGSGIRIGANLGTPVVVQNNQVYNCYLGLRSDSSVAGNEFYGLLLDSGAQNTTVGGSGTGEPNVISGNVRAGVYIGDTANIVPLAISNNVISYNYIGTNLGATAARSTTSNNFSAGVVVENRADSNQIGPGNWISGNTGGEQARGFGVEIISSETTETPLRARNTVIKGNFIGMGLSGSNFVAIPNYIGIGLVGQYGPVDTIIGGPNAADRNYIVGNRQISAANRSDPSGLGIWLFSVGPTPGTVIENNSIGFDPNGQPLGNDSDGIFLQRNGAANSGGFGSTSILRNVIGANDGDGIDIASSTDVVRGNIVSVDPDGLGLSVSSVNGRYSINISGGSGHTIGGSNAADRNVVSIGGLLRGIRLASAASNVTIEGNYIGVGIDGKTPLWSSPPENNSGIWLNGSKNNAIRNNVISNNYNGIELDTNADGNLIEGNFIGTDLTGLVLGANAVPNSMNGILINSGSNNAIRNNVVANNGAAAGRLDIVGGIYFESNAASNNTVAGNRVYNNASRVSDSADVAGVLLSAPSSATMPSGILITQTETNTNRGRGIQFDWPTGNGGIAPPTILSLQAGNPPTAQIRASGCSGCTVEVFTGISSNLSEVDFEGPTYLASGVTDASGNATVSIDGCGDFVTATVTSGTNTSEFTAAFRDSSGVCSLPTFSLTGPNPPSPQQVTPGSSVTYQFQLTNTDSAQRTYSISRSSSAGWAGTPNPTAVTLNGGDSRSISLQVTVPPGAALTDSDTSTLVVRTGLVEKSLDATTTVREAAGPIAAISGNQFREISSAGGTVTFTHAVTNTGDTAGTFSIAATPESPATLPPGWTISSATLDTANLNPGQSTSARLVISVPAGAASGTNVAVRLRVSVGSSNASAIDTIAVTFTPGLEFTPETEQSASSAPGVTLVFDYVLENTGNGTDSYTVVPQSFPPGWSVNTINLDNVPAGATEDVQVRVTIPPGAPEASDQLVTIAASSLSDPGLIETRSIRINVLGAAAPLINPDLTPPGPVDVSTSTQTVTFTHVVSNTGNKAAPFAIDVPVVPTGWTANVLNSSCAVSVPLNGTCSFDLAVTVPQDADARDYTVRVRATAQDSQLTQNALDNTVTVQAFPGLNIGIAPASQAGDPGAELNYTVTVTNTGNGADSYDLSRSISGPAGWTAEITPTRLLDVPRNGSDSATLTLTVPRGVDATTGTATVTVTGTSVLEPAVQASASATADINPIAAAEISPGTTRNADPSDTEPATVTYNHTITNTGSIELNYTIALSNSLSANGWTASVDIESFTLAPGATQNIVVSVTAPAGAEGAPNLTRVRVLDGSTELAAAVNTTQVGPAFGILLEPNVNAGVILPGGSRVYTHTLTNIGSSQDSYTFATIEPQGWETLVTPFSTDLAPGESTVISVTVTAPTSAISGTIDYARVTVVSRNDPELADDPGAQAEEQSTVLQVVDVDVSPRPFVRVSPTSGEVTLDVFEIENLGNGVDTFDVRVRNNRGWTSSFALPNGQTFTTIGPGRSTQMQVKVVVPPDIEPGDFSIVTIEVVSRSNPTKLATTQAVLVYPDPRTFVPLPQPQPQNFRSYLPLVRRGPQ